MLSTLPSGARTKKRRTPQGSSCSGWTISYPSRCASSYAASTSSTFTETTGSAGATASRVTIWRLAPDCGDGCVLPDPAHVQLLGAQPEVLGVDLPRPRDVLDMQVRDDFDYSHRCALLCYCSPGPASHLYNPRCAGSRRTARDPFS